MKDFIINLMSVIVLPIPIIISVLFCNQFSGDAFFVVGCLLIIFGGSLWIIGVRTLGKNFTPSLIPKGFETKGIYSKVRHPVYLGAALFYLGITLSARSIFGILAAFLLVWPLLAYSAREEENQMIARFGNKYLEYKKKTRL